MVTVVVLSRQTRDTTILLDGPYLKDFYIGAVKTYYLEYTNNGHVYGRLEADLTYRAKKRVTLAKDKSFDFTLFRFLEQCKYGQTTSFN